MKREKMYLSLAVILLIAVAVALTVYFATRTERSGTNPEYIVRAGDTCRKIAFEYNISVESIVELNSLAPDCSDLHVGQKLVLPAPVH